MSWKTFTALQERDAYRFAAAVDMRLGYPKTHTEAEVTRRGSGPHAPIASVRTESKCQIVRLANGTFAVFVDADVVALNGQQVTVQDGGARVVTISTAGTVATINTVGATLIAPRGGIVV